MLQKQLSRTSLLSLMLVSCLVALTGCQTFKSTFTSMPKLPEMKLPSPGKLAFWKKDTDTAPPPPPAHHLNPSPTEGMSEMASKSERDDIDIDEYRRKIDEMKDGLAATRDMLESGGKKPLRKPYGSDEPEFSSDSGSFKSSFASADSSIDQGFAKAKEAATGFGSNSLSRAQKQFNAAVADVKKPLDNGSSETPSSFLSTKPANDFKQALADSNRQFKSAIDAAKKKTGFDESLAKVNNSLYDMNGQLTTSSANAMKTVGNSVDAARKQFSNALGSMSDKAVEVAKTSKDFGGDLKNKIVSAASELKPLGGGDNSFKPSFSRAQDPVNFEAKSLLDKAKAKVAGLGTGLNMPGSERIKPAELSGGDFAAGSGGEFNRTRVANVTPVTKGSSGIDSSITRAWNRDGRQSQLRPIETDNSQAMSGNGLRTASLQAANPGSGAASIPSAFDANRNATVGHVGGVEVPAKILSGSGSYAPGSVNKVR